MQELLAQEIDQDELAMLLDVNDVLNAGLERWQALVSLGVGDMGSADEEEGTQLLHDIGHMPWHRASPSGYSDYSDFQVLTFSCVGIVSLNLSCAFFVLKLPLFSLWRPMHS